MDFGKKLKELRTLKGLTQSQLAELLGVTKSTISFYERRERMPSPSTMTKIAAVLHVSLDELMEVQKTKSIDVSGLTDEDIKTVQYVIDALRKKNEKR